MSSSQDSSQTLSIHSQQPKRRRASRPPPLRLGWPASSGSIKTNDNNHKSDNKAGKRPRHGSATTNSTAADATSDSGLWVDKCFPTSSSDLCVAPKKVKEIRGWLDAAVTSRRRMGQKLLVLVGSPGIGKSTAVRVLCDEEGLSILNWNESFVPRTRGGGGSTTGSFSVEQSSAIDSFQEFLQQSAVGFRSLDFIVHSKENTTENRNRNNSNNKSQSDPIILLEELPNLYNADTESKFKTIMEEHLRRTQVPTVLIFSDVSEGKHRPQDLERLIEPRLLYNPNMTTILQIHPVTKPKMKKILEQVARKCGGEITKTLVEELHLQSRGDLRHAIMNLQLLSTGRKTVPKDAAVASNDRDVKLSTFHALGKLLYAKRTQTEDGRSVLAFDPEVILERSDLGVGGSLRFLEYHSVDFFDDITDLSDAFEYFSDAVTLLEPSVTQGYQGSSSLHHTCASAIAGRAVANTNTHPTPNKFRQFSTPRTFDVLKNRSQNQILVDQLSVQLSHSHLSLPSVVGCTNTFVTELLPTLRTLAPNEVEPVVDNLYSIARSNAQAKNIFTGTSWHQKDQASLRDQTAILEVDDIEDFDSSDEKEDMTESRSTHRVVETVNPGRQKADPTPGSSNGNLTQVRHHGGNDKLEPQDVEFVRHRPKDPEIIVIDD